MQLWQLGLLVVVGISSVVLAVHLAGGSRKAIIANLDQAYVRFYADYPDTKIQGGFITASGNAAIFPLGSGAAGLVHAIGDGFLTRLLGAGDIASVNANGFTLALKFNDFTFRDATYAFQDEQIALKAAQILNFHKDIANA